MNQPKFYYFCLLTTFLFLFGSCKKEKINERKLEQMLTAIKALAATSICDNNGTYELKYLRFGTRECAGAGYLAYSTSINTSDLEKRVKEYNDLERAYLDKKNDGIDCLAITIAPKSVTCENGKPKLVY